MEAYKPILNTLTNAGNEAYFVGGCVRDHLLGRECKDVDICTSATPDQVADLFPDSKLVGAHFGVVIVKQGDLEAEVATFRTDGCYSDSRRPDSVAFTTEVQEDLKRRDFTVNTLLMDVNSLVHDWTGGLGDIRNQQIRCMGNPIERFREDALRMLRAVRFSCQLGFSIEERTWLAIKACAPRIEAVSNERVATELTKILCSGKAADGIWDLFTTGLSQFILPELGDMYYTEQNPKYHPEGDVLTHTLGLLQQLPKDCSLTLALAALLHDVGKPKSKGIKDGQPTFHGHEEYSAEIAGDVLRRLKFPNEVIETVVSHCAQHMAFRNTKDMRKSKLFRFLRQPHFTELLELHRLDAMAGSGNLEHYEFFSEMLKAVPPEVLKPPSPLLNGKDLIELGFKPGPMFKEILTDVENRQLEGWNPTWSYLKKYLEDVYGFVERVSQ